MWSCGVSALFIIASLHFVLRIGAPAGACAILVMMLGTPARNTHLNHICIRRKHGEAGMFEFAGNASAAFTFRSVPESTRIRPRGSCRGITFGFVLAVSSFLGCSLTFVVFLLPAVFGNLPALLLLQLCFVYPLLHCALLIQTVTRSVLFHQLLIESTQSSVRDISTLLASRQPRGTSTGEMET